MSWSSSRADLHVHSSRSDGSDPPARVVERAAEAGLALIALTDHDTTEGLEEARGAGRRLGVDVIAGIELSTEYEGREVHLLGYFFDPESPRLQSELARMRSERSRRVEKMVELLNAQGIGVEMPAVRAFAGGRSIGRPHIADALVQGGFVSSYEIAWAEYLRPGGRAYVERVKLPVAGAFDLIGEAGGVTSIAHPTLNLDLQDLERLIGAVAAAAVAARPRDLASPVVPARLHALETTHPKLGEPDAAGLRKLCERYGLAESGGSDCHGARRGEPTMGRCSIPLELVETLRTLRGTNGRRGSA